MTTARKNSSHEHYVNNKEFSQAVVDYVKSVKAAKATGQNEPRITEYIGRCFLRIAEGLSHKPNFIRYTYREEMVADAVENCVKAVMNYNVEAATRSGSPNAFAYFTQICYYAFLRRIAKEKKLQDIKYRYIEHCSIEDFMENHEFSGSPDGQDSGFINQLKNRIDKVKTKDKNLVAFVKAEKVAKKQALEGFMS